MYFSYYRCTPSIDSVLPSAVSDLTFQDVLYDPCWSSLQVPNKVNFLNLTRGLIPNLLVATVIKCSCSQAQAQSIVISTVALLLGLLQRQCWQFRCDDLIKFERSQGITCKKKKSGVQRDNLPISNTVASSVRRVRASARSSNVVNEEWYIWHNYVCQYGGSFLDF